jgi:hypothetical protein
MHSFKLLAFTLLMFTALISCKKNQDKVPESKEFKVEY